MFKVFWIWKEKDDEILSPDMDLDVDFFNDEIDEDDLEEEIWQVALDVLEWEEKIYIIAPIAWVELEKVDISLHKTVLTIKWNRKKPDEYSEEGIVIRNSECYFGKFLRNIILPENLELNKVRAYMENNMLIVSVPKLIFGTKSIKIDRLES